MGISRTAKLTMAGMALTLGLNGSGIAYGADSEPHRKGILDKVFGGSNGSSSTAAPDKEKKTPKEKEKEKSAKEKKANDADKVADVGGEAAKKAEKQAAKDAAKKQARVEKDEVKKDKDDKKEKKAATPEKCEVQQVSAAPAQVVVSEAATVNNPFELDASLLSVMRDINKSLHEQDNSNIEDPAQRAALKATIAALDAALGKTSVAPNRIVSNANRERYENKVAAQSWESGDIALPDGGHVSLNVLWAKKVNGLLNISVSGNCGCRANSAGERAGEFVVVINGKSTLDSGFDIQSQSDVNFWLGKLNNINIDATTCGDKTSASDAVPRLKALLTDSQRRYLLSHPELLAQKPEAPEIAGAGDQKKSSNPGNGAQDQLTGRTDKKALLANAPVGAVAAVSASAAGSGSGAAAQANSTTIAATRPLPPFELAPATTARTRRAPDNPFVDSARLPSPAARIIAPRRALAGQYVTVCVLDAMDKPESLVELNLNDYKSTTNADGLLVYQVPEDLAPGPSLSVAFSARPQVGAASIDVLHPLVAPSPGDVPKIDKVVHHKGAETIIIIDGHNFDGIADHNRVIVDGTREARVFMSSPVQIKAILPAVLEAGNHPVIVERSGVRSEPIMCNVQRQGGDSIVVKTRKKS